MLQATRKQIKITRKRKKNCKTEEGMTNIIKSYDLKWWEKKGYKNKIHTWLNAIKEYYARKEKNC